MSSNVFKETRLSDVSEKIGMGPFGSNIKVDTFVTQGIPVVSGNHLCGPVLDDNTFNFITKEHAERLASANVFRGDVIFTHAGNIKNVAYIPENSKYKRYVLSQRQFFLRPDKKRLNSAYLSYFFHSPQGQYLLLANSSQVGVPSIAQPVTYLRSLKLLLPELAIQEQIVKILGDLDRKIELNRRISETLEQIGQALFKKFFIDNPKESWGYGILEDVAVVETGKGSVKTQLSESGKYPLYGANGVVGTSNNFMYDHDVIVMGRVGTLGKVKIIQEKAWFSDNVLIVKPVEHFLGYIYFFLRMVDYKSMNRGSTQPLITQTDIRNIKLKVPPSELVVRFESTCEMLFKLINSHNAEMATLIQIRDLLLAKLVTGKISI